MTHFLGRPHGPLSSSFSSLAVCAGWLAGFGVDVVVGFGASFFSCGAAVGFSLPSSHAKETLATVS
jgi:hypothetical protein